MSNLTLELQIQIANEADKYGFVVPYNNSKSFYIEDKVKGYIAGATVYADKWQEAEQRAERYRKSLNILRQFVCALMTAAGNMNDIAGEALTPKQTTNGK